VYNLCSLKYEQAQSILYQKYTQSIKDYLNNNVVDELKRQNGPELLIILNKRWADHEITVNWMQKFFQYLDRYYVEMHSIASLQDQGYKIFKEIAFNPLCDKLTTAICSQVKK
jgi:cullin 1